MEERQTTQWPKERRTVLHKTLHNKPRIEQHERHKQRPCCEMRYPLWIPKLIITIIEFANWLLLLEFLVHLIEHILATLV